MPAYKDKQRNTWYANFYYTDWTGKKVHKCKRGFKRQADAKAWEKEFLDQLSTNSDILFKDLVENYLKDMDNRLKQTTMGGKRNIIETKILPWFADFKLYEINALTVRKWQNEIISFRDPDGNPYAETYQKTINNQLSAIFNYAARNYGLTVNPCKAAGSIGESNADEMNIWTRDEFEHVISFEQKPYFKLAFKILFYTGIREGELLALTPADILPSKQLNIWKNFAVVNREWVVMEPKTKKSKRKLSIPEFLFTEIQDYISKLYEIQDTDRIFLFTKSALISEIKRIAKLANIEQIRVHDLRHSHAAMLIDMKEDIYEISRLLGHGSIKTTIDTYGH